MKQPKLQSTKNASLFVYNDEQRPIHQQHVNFLASSMSRHGFLPSKAIQCYRRKDGKLIVIDGHHRLEAAKTLGITFYYVVESATSQQAMPDVNRSRQWGIADFIRQYAMRGLPDYKRLSDYIASGLNPPHHFLLASLPDLQISPEESRLEHSRLKQPRMQTKS